MYSNANYGYFNIFFLGLQYILRENVAKIAGLSMMSYKDFILVGNITAAAGHKLYFSTHYNLGNRRNSMEIDPKISALKTVLSAYLRIW